MSYPIICTSCAATATVNKITAGLRHACGGEVDLYLGTEGQLAAVARRQTSSFDAWMGHTATSGEEDNGSNEYAGQMPGPNPMSNHEGKITCPVCHGSGKDIQDKTDPCRECDGDGVVTPTTTPEDVQVAKHSYPPSGPTGQRDRQTKVPFMGRRRRDPGPNYGRMTKRNDMIQTVARTNPGLAAWEVEALVDETLRRYPEVR